MAKVYVRKILDKESGFTIDDVPSRWRAEVEELLKAQPETE